MQTLNLINYVINNIYRTVQQLPLHWVSSEIAWNINDKKRTSRLLRRRRLNFCTLTFLICCSRCGTWPGIHWILSCPEHSDHPAKSDPFLRDLGIYHWVLNYLLFTVSRNRSWTYFWHLNSRTHFHRPQTSKHSLFPFSASTNTLFLTTNEVITL